MSDHTQTAIITGATGGIGRAVSQTLAENGFNLVLAGTSAEKLKALEAALDAPGGVLTVAGDVGVAADRTALVAAALERFGRIDVLVNNAGIFEPRPFLEVDEAQLDRFLDVNFKSTFFLSQAVIPEFRKVGGGAIINLGTVLVDHAIAGVPTAGPISSKGAIHALTVQLAAEFARDNIRVNVVAPGIIRTPMHPRNGIENADSLAGLHLLNRVGEPEDIASAVLLLAKSDFMTGTVVKVDGGHIAGHALH